MSHLHGLLSSGIQLLCIRGRWMTVLEQREYVLDVFVRERHARLLTAEVQVIVLKHVFYER